MTSDCAPSCNGECHECSPPVPQTCEACLIDIDEAARIVAGAYVHASCALFWEGLCLLSERPVGWEVA